MANTTVQAVDDTFGPFIEPISTTLFDCTRLFEESILSIGPSAILLLITPLRIWHISKISRRVTRRPLAITKLVSIYFSNRDDEATEDLQLLLAVFIILQATNLALWATTSASQTRTSVAAAALSFAAGLSLACLSYFEHLHSIRPSSLINMYLLVTVPMDFAQVRTLWLRGNFFTVAAVFSSASAVKLAVLVAEAVEKHSSLLSPFKNHASESISGIYSRASFWWLNPLFLLGYKEVITNDSLLATDEKLMSEPAYRRFQHWWLKYRSVRSRFALLGASARAMLLPLATAIIPRLSLIFFRFMQPFLIHSVSRFVAQPVTEYTTKQGWGLTGAYGLVYLGIAFSQAIYYHQIYRMVTMIRGALVSAIYAKTVQLATITLDESAAVTLMSTDVQRICDALPQLHEVWASVIEIALGVWLLTRVISLALLGPLVVTTASVFATMAVSNRMGSAQKSWMEAIQTRIDITAKMLQSMKGVKMLGLTPAISTLIRGMRKHEIDLSLKARKLLAICLSLANVSSTLAPGVAFILYTAINRDGDQTLDVSRAFTTLSLISLVTGPVATLIFAVPPLMGSLGCVDRIQSFLFSDTRNDHRITLVSTDSEAKIHNLSARAATQDIELKTVTPTTTAASRGSPPVRLHDVSFSWSVDGPPVVSNITFELIRSSLTFVIGPVGSGKTSLLRGILGEIPSTQGFVYVDSPETAYVSQTPWIQHKTLRSNILGTSVFDRPWYDTVIHACALDGDIVELPQGDLTLVGSDGHGLSGGQKLRLALARAVYSRRQILLLDDCFSGVDAESEESIFSRLLGRRGLLRQLGITVLLVTHAIHRASYADRIIALTAEGTISEEGTLSELMRKRGYVSSLAARHKSEDDDTDRQPSKAANTKAPSSTSDSTPEEPVRPLGDVQVYKYYFAAIGWFNTATFFVLIMSFAFFSKFPDLWMKFWTSAVAEHGNSVNATYLGVFMSLGVIALLCVVGVAFHVFTTMVPTSATNLHDTLLSTVMSAPWSFFTSTQTGQTLNRFSQDMNLIDSELPLSLIQVSGPLCLGILQAILICLSAAYFVTTLPIVLLVLYFLQKYYLRTSRQIRLLDLEAKSPLYSHFLETLNGLVTIRAFGWAKDFEDQNLALLDRSQKPFYLLFCVQRWLTLVLDLIVAALAVILMIMVVKLRASLDAGLVALALLNVMSFTNNLTAVIQMWTNLETSLGTISRLKTFNEITHSENLTAESAPVPEYWPVQGKIDFTNVSAAYSTTLPNAISNVNLSISPRERIGICGVSGSGKSSLIATLLRLLEITSGSILIDGVDISLVPRQSIRERLVVIPQEPFFLKGSIRLNIDQVHTSSDGEIQGTLQKVGLWDIITASTPSGGIDSEMVPEVLLSHGQRQLFSLARAILKVESIAKPSVSSDRPGRPTPIVIFDEPSSSLDPATDALTQRLIRDVFVHCTLLVVAHRLHTIVDLDRVVVMDKGAIVEVGPPRALLAQEHGQGWFRRFWDS